MFSMHTCIRRDFASFQLTLSLSLSFCISCASLTSIIASNALAGKLQQGVSIRPFIRWFLWHTLCYRWWLSLYVRKHSLYTPCPFSLFLHPIPHCLPRRTDWMFALRSSFDHFKVQTNICIPAAHFWFACACGTGVSVAGVRAAEPKRVLLTNSLTNSLSIKLGTLTGSNENYMLKRTADCVGTQEAQAPDDENSDSVSLSELHDTLTEAADQLSKVLILIDFNGLLVCKDKLQGGVIPMTSRHKPDFVVRYNKFFIRPFAREFVCHLLNDPRCEVQCEKANLIRGTQTSQQLCTLISHMSRLVVMSRYYHVSWAC